MADYPEQIMIDIHMHLTPGVDDGAEDMMMALMMIMKAGDQGIRGVFSTPHSSAFDHHRQETEKNYRQLQSQVSGMFPDMKLYPGCEVYCDADRMAETIQALISGRYPTMNGTKYVLMEFSQWVMPEMTLPCVEAIVKAGYIPIIAHMERYQYLRGNMVLADGFREKGALIQVNAYSLSDEMNEDIKSWARQLVQEKKVTFLGTDAHRTYHRPPSAARGLNWLYSNMDAAYADAIAWGNAQTLLLEQGEAEWNP